MEYEGHVMKILTNRERKLLFYRVSLCIIFFSGVSAAFAFFLPEKWLAGIGVSALCMILIMWFLLYRYLKGQDELLIDASNQITEYIAGDFHTRIACDEEGEIYRLFHRINSLAAILNARVEDEVKSREFLKNTISDISHQLKTPLAALNIYNGILQEETKEDGAVKELVDFSEQELDRIETLIQNLLKITKFDAGTILMSKSTENIADIMESVKKHFLFRATQEGKKICLTGDPQVSLWCDRGWLIEAIDNIVKNALDHTTEGGMVHIRWRADPSIVQIVVEDNGSGIHPQDLYHIFKRFYRSRFSKDTQGIGLGLPLAKAIIEAHNGTIEVDSQKGRGTIFTVIFLKER